MQRLVDYPSDAMSLDVPDGSRKIIDSVQKLQGLNQLKADVDELAADIAREVNPLFTNTPDFIQKRLMEAHVF